jgi:hypothetical protein
LIICSTTAANQQGRASGFPGYLQDERTKNLLLTSQTLRPQYEKIIIFGVVENRILTLIMAVEGYYRFREAECPGGLLQVSFRLILL